MKAKNALIPVVGLALAVQAGGCKKDKTSNTDLLVGEWELVKLDGVTPTNYTFSFEFQEDKDFRFCSQYGSLSYCYNGEWNWGNSDEDEVEMTWDDGSNTYSGNIQVEDLSKDELKGDFTVDGTTYQIELEKVN